MPASPNVVLDSFALIAFLRDETGADTIEQILQDAAADRCRLWMTEVNYAEVRYILERKEGLATWQASAAAIATLPIRFVSADRSLADAAAAIKAYNKLSLADAFAAALAQELPATLITADPEFKALSDTLSIDWLK
ncbi:PIN domain-containing protein [Actomonas aquatica]|uniref:Ribonuclease VapC n=1 Tax=Actomonas aquatica TaxID=2866162 RepID=A0ABZ1C6A9_9BACT|nr:PIN domain-containing protein [Opitutus sp. WL0086]WRQ87267.1 PIN domain-containing protein [Opitutus sp. WL0086]